jgi:PAS domain S-box-containing protein
MEDPRDFLESLIQSIGVGILLYDGKDTITFLNRAGEKILGYSETELVGRPFRLLGLREKEGILQSLLDPPNDLEFRKEGWVKRKDQTEFPIGFTLNDHLNRQGKALGKIMIFRDLTPIYKNQEEILRMDRLISLGKLASGIAHEIRNPLAGIKTTAQALGEDLSSDDPQREYLNRITKEIDRLNELLKTFFSFAKPQSLILADYPIQEMISEILPFLMKEIADKGIHFKEQYHPSLPKVNVDKAQIHQVFLNLFLNAIQAMPEGGELKIEASPIVSTSAQGIRRNFIRIIVSDTGRGIPLSIVQKIFDPFFTTRPKGIGLGLSIAYQIINKHGGTITVDPSMKRGTSFVIHLPETVGNR